MNIKNHNLQLKMTFLSKHSYLPKYLLFKYKRGLLKLPNTYYIFINEYIIYTFIKVI